MTFVYIKYVVAGDAPRGGAESPHAGGGTVV